MKILKRFAIDMTEKQIVQVRKELFGLHKFYVIAQTDCVNSFSIKTLEFVVLDQEFGDRVSDRIRRCYAIERRRAAKLATKKGNNERRGNKKLAR